MSRMYRYTKSIDGKVAKAVEDVLGVKVLSSRKMAIGEINHVYKVVTDKNAVVARVFGYADQPAQGMLEWIEKKLTAYRIPHAKLLHYTRDKKFFPNGFMISEFVEGQNGWEAIDTGVHSLAQSYEQSGKILRRIYQISLPKYGPINSRKGTHDNFIDMEIAQVKRKLRCLTRRKAVPVDTFEKVSRMITQCLEPYQHTFRPVLLHADASRENSIWTKDKRFILIDWDNAWSGIWMWDYIESSWWWLHLKEWKSENMRNIARKAFFKGYGTGEYSPQEIDVIQHGLFLIKSVEKMHYYLLDKKDTKNFNLVKRIFFQLLNKRDVFYCR